MLLAIVGFWGAGYVFRVMLRARAFGEYIPDLEDWTLYWIVPLVAYAAIAVAAIALIAFPTQALFFVAGATVLLIFVAIRNAWDVVTFVTLNE